MKAYNLTTAQQQKEQVTELYLHGLGMAEWPSLIFEMPLLKVLCLSENRLQEVPARIAGLKMLKVLDLGGNQIQALPDSLVELEGLAEVNLSRNQFVRFPVQLTRLPALRHLDLSDNRIPGFPKRLPFGNRLRVLRAGNNRIKSLPEEWEPLEELEELILDRNKLTGLPRWLPMSPALRILSLNRNKLTSIPGHWTGAAGLTDLGLCWNALEHIPSGIGSLRALRRLWLDHNRLREFPSALSRLEALRLLSCKANKLDAWPAVLEKLPRLETLRLGQNQIRFLPDDLGAFPKLEHLGLEKNGLSAIPSAIAGLPGLKSLDLRRNHFSQFPEDLIVAPKLEKVEGLPGAAKALRFVDACRQADVPEACRRELFRIWEGRGAIGQISDEALRQGLRLPLPSLRKALLAGCLVTSLPSEASGLLFASSGKLRLGQKKWKERLEKAGFALWRGQPVLPACIILGAGTLDIPAEWIRAKVPFLEEASLHQYLQSKERVYILEAGGSSQLQMLLQSKQEASLRLALTLIKTGGLPSGLLTDLYLAWKTAVDPPIKRELRDLLQLQASPGGRRFLESQATIQSYERLEEATRGSGFDAGRIWEWWQGRSGT